MPDLVSSASEEKETGAGGPGEMHQISGSFLKWRSLCTTNKEQFSPKYNTHSVLVSIAEIVRPAVKDL